MDYKPLDQGPSLIIKENDWADWCIHSIPQMKLLGDYVAP
jgi:hypothetical protein